MQHKIIAFYKKVIAALTAFILSLGITCGGGDSALEIIRGEINIYSAFEFCDIFFHS